MSDGAKFTRQFNIATYKIKGMTSDAGVEFTKFIRTQSYLCRLTKTRIHLDAKWKYYTQELECRLGEETDLYTWEERARIFFYYIEYSLLEYRRSEKEKVLASESKMQKSEYDIYNFRYITTKAELLKRMSIE